MRDRDSYSPMETRTASELKERLSAFLARLAPPTAMTTSEVTAAHVELDGHPTLSALAADHGGALFQQHLRDLSKRHTLAAWGRHEELAQHLRIGSRSFGKAHLQRKAPLAFEHRADRPATDG